jgi:hypothetical protein
VRRAAAVLACMVSATPAAAQLADAGFVPALVPHTVAQPVVVSAGFVRWRGSSGSVARADYWAGRVGIGGAVGSLHGAGADGVHGSAAIMLELLPQGVGPRAPGLQLQAGYAATRVDGAHAWRVPVAAGILIHGPVPLGDRTHALIHPSLSVRSDVAGSARGTSAGLALRLILNDRAGVLTLWGVHGYVRLVASGAAGGPQWELAVARVLRGPASHER